MKLLFILIGVVLLLICVTACSTTPAPHEATPAWLRMKPGYAQGCIDGGGCTPFTDEELRQVVQTVQKRTLEMCKNSI